MRTLAEAPLDETEREVLQEVKAVVQAHLPDAEVILFGSAARGEREQYSDYDVYVLTDDAISRELQKAIETDLYELELERNALVMVLFCTRTEWLQHPRLPLHREILRDGVLL